MGYYSFLRLALAPAIIFCLIVPPIQLGTKIQFSATVVGQTDTKL